MSLFTPLQGIIGGSLIGGSAGALLVLNGDIMGCSGILSNTLVNPIESIQKPQNRWRYVYLASFCMSVNIFVNHLAPKEFHSDERSLHADVPIPSTLAYMLGGFLVGVGTKVGNGCTTGHGICGMSRFSKRSLFATLTFTGGGILTRYVISPLRSWASSFNSLRAVGFSSVSPLGSSLMMASTVFMAMLSPALSSKNRPKDEVEAENEESKILGSALSGVLFCAGLAISGMTSNSKVHDFLCLSGLSRGSFDPTLIAVLGSGIISSWISYQFVKDHSLFPEKALTCPTVSKKGCFSVPSNTNVDAELISGALTFGVGWGLTGICPGPGLFAAASGNVNALTVWLPCFLFGSYVGGKVKDAFAAAKKKTV